MFPTAYVTAGNTVEEIMSTLELSRASVNSYLPYTKIVYKMKESSVSADREKLYRERKKACERLKKEPTTENLWRAIVAFQGYPFKTSKALSFTYKVKGGELFFTRKEKSITEPRWILLLRGHWNWGRMRPVRRSWECSAPLICTQCLCSSG